MISSCPSPSSAIPHRQDEPVAVHLRLRTPHTTQRPTPLGGFRGNATGQLDQPHSLLPKELGKCAVRLLLRKESEGTEDAKPSHSAYRDTATISLLPKESGKCAVRQTTRRFHSFRRSRENARFGYSFGRSQRERKMQNHITEPIPGPWRFHSFRRGRENMRIGYSFGRSKRGRKMQNRRTAHIETPRRFHSFRRGRENARFGYSFGRSHCQTIITTGLTAGLGKHRYIPLTRRAICSAVPIL